MSFLLCILYTVFTSCQARFKFMFSAILTASFLASRKFAVHNDNANMLSAFFYADKFGKVWYAVLWLLSVIFLLLLDACGVNYARCLSVSSSFSASDSFFLRTNLSFLLVPLNFHSASFITSRYSSFVNV